MNRATHRTYIVNFVKISNFVHFQRGKSASLRRNEFSQAPIVDSTRVDGRYSTRITFYRSRLSRRNNDDRIYSAVLKTLATYKSDKTVIWNLAMGICSGF